MTAGGAVGTFAHGVPPYDVQSAGPKSGSNGEKVPPYIHPSSGMSSHDAYVHRMLPYVSVACSVASGL